MCLLALWAKSTPHDENNIKMKYVIYEPFVRYFPTM